MTPTPPTPKIQLGAAVRVRLDRDLREKLTAYRAEVNELLGGEERVSVSAVIRDLLWQALCDAPPEDAGYASGFREGFLRAYHETKKARTEAAKLRVVSSNAAGVSALGDADEALVE